MSRRALLAVTAVVEIAAGLALLLAPAAVAWLLIGARPQAPVQILLGRVAGLGLAALGGACALRLRLGAAGEGPGLLRVLLSYNLAVALALAGVGLFAPLRGIGLWPAVAIHGGLALWCLACLRQGKGR